MSGTVRKRADELKVGDEVVGYGVLTTLLSLDNGLVYVERREPTLLKGLWPADAEVTVKVKVTVGKWQRTITQTTADAKWAKAWRAEAGEKRGTPLVIESEYGEVVEL